MSFVPSQIPCDKGIFYHNLFVSASENSAAERRFLKQRSSSSAPNHDRSGTLFIWVLYFISLDETLRRNLLRQYQRYHESYKC